MVNANTGLSRIALLWVPACWIGSVCYILSFIFFDIASHFFLRKNYIRFLCSKVGRMLVLNVIEATKKPHMPHASRLQIRTLKCVRSETVAL